MHQGYGSPFNLLVLAGPDIQSTARWEEVPPAAVPMVVSDPYSAAEQVVKGRWDVLLVDPGFLSTPVISLIAGATSRHLKVWIFETAANPALFHLALRAGAVSVSKLLKTNPPSQNGNGHVHTNGSVPQEAPVTALMEARIEEPDETPVLAGRAPAIMTDEEAIRVALGYGRSDVMAAQPARKKRLLVPGMEAIVEEDPPIDPEQPILTDAELRALLGEEEV